MRNLVVSMFLTLDGVMEAPDKWSFPFWNSEISQFKFNELFSSDALLLGRVTYQGFAGAWPKMKDEEGYADRMNSLPKYVASTTLNNLEWSNSQLIQSEVAEQVAQLKEQPGQDLLVFGSATLVQTLIHHDLVDRYNLLVYPLLRGTGKHLFQDGNQAGLKLVDTRLYSSGVVGMIYEVDRNPA